MENELSHVAERGELDSRLAERLGRAIARYHCSAPVRSGKDGSHLIADIIDELNREFRAMDDLLGREHIERFTSAARAALDDLAPLLDQRTRDGHVRRCHGDLHLRNIVLIGDEPVLYDALEFDETLGTCDVLYDLAFLLMDMHHRNIGSAANRALNAYVRNAETDDHLTGLAALPLFIAVRAAISAMVAVHTARASGDDGEDRARDARHYLADAIAALEPQRPVLVAIGGLSGTGKTTIARLLASQIGAVPGAVHLRSDLIRKAMAGADPLSRLPAEEYSADSSRRVYDEICQKAVRTLEAGHSVIADATFLDPFERVAIEEAAEKADAPFAGIWLTAPEPVLLERVAARRGDTSDADVPVLKQQIARDVGDISWAIFDASTAADAAARDIRLAITETAGL